MTKDDRQKFGILIVLLGVLAVTIVLGYRMNQPPTTEAVQPAEPKTSANPPAANDARIRLDLVEKDATGEHIGKKNVFQYREQPAPPPPKLSAPPPTPVPLNTAPPVAARPLTPPGPPPIQLKYQGFATVNTGSGQFTAVLADESRHYLVKTGEILMGRYRIARITDTSVEVEDLEFNRRQVLPIQR
jgi:hypothetical protein